MAATCSLNFWREEIGELDDPNLEPSEPPTSASSQHRYNPQLRPPPAQLWNSCEEVIEFINAWSSLEGYAVSTRSSGKDCHSLNPSPELLRLLSSQGHDTSHGTAPLRHWVDLQYVHRIETACNTCELMLRRIPFLDARNEGSTLAQKILTPTPYSPKRRRHRKSNLSALVQGVSSASMSTGAGTITPTPST